MKFKSLLFTLLFFASTIFSLHAEEVKIGFEPFPPLILDENNGFVIELLKKAEQASDLKFSIKIMPYSRGKVDLKAKKLDLMGLTPYQHETKEFYQYAQELDWNIMSKMDVMSHTEKNTDEAAYKTLKKIGTPFGNKEFMSDVFGIPANQFIENKAENLIKMLSTKRIDAYIFERASTFIYIKNLKLENIYYRNILSMPASMAVGSDENGIRLKKKLDGVLKSIDTDSIFKEYLEYLNLPDYGIVQN